LPFGNDIGNPRTTNCPGPGVDATEHHFTGKERDTESGNDYFDARYYSSAMGRFMSPDWSAKEEPIPYAKLGDPQSLNLYAYVYNNPITGVDPDGHAPFSFGGFQDCHARGDCGEEINNAASKANELNDYISSGTVGTRPGDVLAQETINSVTPASANQIQAPPIVPGTLIIDTSSNHSSSNPSGFMDGHAWLTFTTDDGVTYTYGTWGNNAGAQGVQGVNENTELDAHPTANRALHINADQARSLNVYISDMIRQGPDAWSTSFPCFSFAAVGWNLVTSEHLDPMKGGILSTPTNLQNSIIEANGGTN